MQPLTVAVCAFAHEETVKISAAMTAVRANRIVYDEKMDISRDQSVFELY
jgi:hypothetical protein